MSENIPAEGIGLHCDTGSDATLITIDGEPFATINAATTLDEGVAVVSGPGRHELLAFLEWAGCSCRDGGP